MNDAAVKQEMKSAETKMGAAIDALGHHLNTIRTGRASTALLDDVRVEAYGVMTPLQQVATVGTPDARSISIQPWDRTQLTAIERALLASDLGLTPMNDGQRIILNIPPLTEDRRKELVKKSHGMGEDARIAIRNVRRHVKDHFDKANKNKEMTDDEKSVVMDDLQKLTDKFIAKVDEVMKKKEKEIMEV